MRKLDIFKTALTALILLSITTILFLYTSGYRLRKAADNQIDVDKTGMVSAKSLPKGANVYLDDRLVTATDDTVAGVIQGLHTLKITKKGFVDWRKDIEVYEELVTDITAILVAQSPRLEPLTNTGAKQPSISPSLSKLAYFSSGEEKPGIWIIPLSNGLSLFRSNPVNAVQDTRFTKYSAGKSIEWSHDEKNLLIEGEMGTYYVANLETNTAQVVANPEEIREGWSEKLIEKRNDFIEKLEIPEDIKDLAISSKAVWSPDENKFLYTVQNRGKLEYKVYNLEEPLPIGEKSDNFVFETNALDPQPKITWYSDSFHLLIVRGDVAADKHANISIIRIDGTNETEIYNNTLCADTVFSAPSGDKIIVLTTFKSGDQTDLYTVSIR